MKKKRYPADDEAQSRAFMEKAREIGANKKNNEADKTIGALAKMPPNPRKKKSG